MFVPDGVLRDDFSQSVAVMTNHFANSLKSYLPVLVFSPFCPLLWGALRAKCAASSASWRRRRSNVTEEYIWIHLALQAICSLLPGFPPHKFCLTADFHSARSEGRLVTFECLPDWLPRRHSLKCNIYYASSPALFFVCLFFLFHLLICAGTSEPRHYFCCFFSSSSLNCGHSWALNNILWATISSFLFH